MKELSLLIEKFIHAINIEESEYIRNSDLNKLSSTQIHYLDLINHENDPTVSTLSKILKVTKPSATVHIEKLLQLGLIRKEQSTEDGRVQFLKLTEEGKEIAKKHDMFHEVFTRKIVEDISLEEINDFVKILSKILK